MESSSMQLKNLGWRIPMVFGKPYKLSTLDADGDLDIVAGNKGENSLFEKHMRMYVSDFDNKWDCRIYYLLSERALPIIRL